jgi:hypothetical protein
MYVCRFRAQVVRECEHNVFFLNRACTAHTPSVCSLPPSESYQDWGDFVIIYSHGNGEDMGTNLVLSEVIAKYLHCTVVNYDYG